MQMAQSPQKEAPQLPKASPMFWTIEPPHATREWRRAESPPPTNALSANRNADNTCRPSQARHGSSRKPSLPIQVQSWNGILPVSYPSGILSVFPNAVTPTDQAGVNRLWISPPRPQNRTSRCRSNRRQLRMRPGWRRCPHSRLPDNVARLRGQVANRRQTDVLVPALN
jgi:hypothetical protein